MNSLIDYEQLRLELLEASTNTIAQLQEVAETEHFYTFGFYINDEASYIVPTANTLEGLARKAHANFQKFGRTEEDCIILLKWMPTEWTYHLEGNELFSQVQKTLYQGWTDNFSDFLVDRGQVLRICLEVLVTLKDEGLFSKIGGDAILLNVFTGDRNFIQLLQQAQLLNSSDVYITFRHELEQVIKDK